MYLSAGKVFRSLKLWEKYNPPNRKFSNDTESPSKSRTQFNFSPDGGEILSLQASFFFRTCKLSVSLTLWMIIGFPNSSNCFILPIEENRFYSRSNLNFTTYSLFDFDSHLISLKLFLIYKMEIFQRPSWVNSCVKTNLVTNNRCLVSVTTHSLPFLYFSLNKNKKKIHILKFSSYITICG